MRDLSISLTNDEKRAVARLDSCPPSFWTRVTSHQTSLRRGYRSSATLGASSSRGADSDDDDDDDDFDQPISNRNTDSYGADTVNRAKWIQDFTQQENYDSSDDHVRGSEERAPFENLRTIVLLSSRVANIPF